jgi:hypothetical protein
VLDAEMLKQGVEKLLQVDEREVMPKRVRDLGR